MIFLYSTRHIFLFNDAKLVCFQANSEFIFKNLSYLAKNE